MAASTKKTSPAKKAGKKTNPVAPPAVTTVDDYRRTTAVQPEMLVQLPSGHWVRMRRPGLHEFLQRGVLPDPLASQIGEMIERGTLVTPSQRKAQEQRLNKAMQDSLNNPEALADMMRAMKRVAASCWLEPRLAYHERQRGSGEIGEFAWEVIPAEERDTATYLYTDEVDEEDITFTFTYVSGGGGDVERFRADAGASVGAVLRSEDVGVSAEQPAQP